MGSDTPKVLLTAYGRPLVYRVVETAIMAGADKVVVVVSSRGREQVRQVLEGLDSPAIVQYAVQEQPRGTADALLSCRDFLSDSDECVVLYGDAPLITSGTVRHLVQVRKERGADVAVFTANLSEPGDYGRVIRAEGDEIDRIVEKRDASAEELKVREVNSGLYAFRWGRVRPAVERIRPSASSGEYYLTDMVREVKAEGGRVLAVLAEDPAEMMGANTPADLALIEQELKRRESGCV